MDNQIPIYIESRNNDWQLNKTNIMSEDNFSQQQIELQKNLDIEMGEILHDVVDVYKTLI